MEQVGIWDRSLQLLFEITSDAMLLVDLSRNGCVAINPAAVRLLEQPLPQLLAQTLDTLLPGLPATIWQTCQQMPPQSLPSLPANASDASGAISAATGRLSVA
jgi:PAS domain-containing protein